MVAADEDALICDLAETYGIYVYETLPPRVVSVLAAGLRDNARIKMKLSGQNIDLDRQLMAVAVDRLGLLVWAKTKDGQRGRNRPKSILAQITGAARQSNVRSFDTAEEFEAERKKILEGTMNHGD